MVLSSGLSEKKLGICIFKRLTNVPVSSLRRVEYVYGTLFGSHREVGSAATFRSYMTVLAALLSKRMPYLIDNVP